MHTPSHWIQFVNHCQLWYAADDSLRKSDWKMHKYQNERDLPNCYKFSNKMVGFWQYQTFVYGTRDLRQIRLLYTEQQNFCHEKLFGFSEF